MRVEVIDSDGRQRTADIISREATIDSEQIGTIEPSVVQSIKFDNKGLMSSLTTVCGETENRREGDNKPSITVEGLIRESEIDDMKALKFEPEIRFVSDIYRGSVIVKRLSISQDTDVLYFNPSGGEEETAFSFQLQLEEP